MNTDISIFEKLKSSKHLPSLPQILLKLIEACNDDKTTPYELSQITAVDPSLTSKVLRLVNSSYMGFMTPITSLEKAVIYLGADTIKNIAISTSILQTFSTARGDTFFNLRQFWWHSFMCASLSRRIAKITGYKNPEEAFLTGLLHDIAKLLLWKQFPKKYGLIIKESGNDLDRLLDHEQKLGATHADIGAWLIRRWNLDSFMADAIYYHHAPVTEILDAFPLVKITYVANILSLGPDRMSENAEEAAKRVLGFTTTQTQEIQVGAKKEVTEVAAALDISIEPPPDTEGETLQVASEDLTNEIKHISLLYGTLENLIRADSQDAILRIVERGIKILFDIKTLFFFLYDPQTDLLTGNTPEEYHRVKDLVIPYKEQKCIPAASLSQNRALDSFSYSELTISDKQLIQLLGSEGIFCLPLVAYQQPIGVIVMGIREAQISRLKNQQKLLTMFGNHSAVCLYIEDFKAKQAGRIRTERMAATSSMARKVAHEVNNPLGIIKNYLKILGVKLPERHPAQSDIRIIAEEIDRVSKIIRQLNSFSQPEPQKIAPININHLLKKFLKIVRKSILLPAGIHDQTAFEPKLPAIVADENSLKQVFLNLFKNAAEAMPKGGNLYIETRQTRQGREDDNETAQGHIEVTIRDEGAGIPQDIRSRLFEPFISGKDGEHRGLGLSIVHNIIQELNGTITCNSDLKTGTEFIITLPITS